MKKNPEVTRQVRDWIEAGNTGTVTQISQALGINRKDVPYRLMALLDDQVAAVVDEVEVGGRLMQVWGRGVNALPADFRQRGVVAHAIASRPYLMTAWMQPVGARA